MAYENIKFRKRNLAVLDGYFYTIEEDSDILLKKTDDGTTAFTYPLDTLLGGNEVRSLEHDGVYFWSLEDSGVANEIIIKRWLIDNYVCKLQHTYTLSPTDTYGGQNHNFESYAFSIEHYHTTFTSSATAGDTVVYINDYWDSSTISGAVVHLGPNTDGEYEDVTVTGTVSSGIMVTPTSYDYAIDDDVQYYTNLWLFNNFDVTDSSTGALYKFAVTHSGISYVNHYPGGAYKDIQSATFYKVDSFSEYGEVDTLAYIKATNLLFVNTGSAATNLPYYGSMVMDNIENDEATVITVYDLSMDDQNVYRLQLKSTYYGSTYTWSTYNYQMASLNSFVTSLALAAYPGIIAANTVSTASIVATVKDQFGQPIVGRLVYFTEDDSVGSISGGTPINTDSDGVSSTVYKSGNTAREVKITATVEQV